MLDSVGLKKVEDKSKQFLIEKIIHGVEFENLYQSNTMISQSFLVNMFSL